MPGMARIHRVIPEHADRTSIHARCEIALLQSKQNPVQSTKSKSHCFGIAHFIEIVGNMDVGKTRAYGKLILFGEHFVVYKAPALVGAVSSYTGECSQ